MLVALPGILIILLMTLTVREPVRREQITPEGTVSLRRTLKHVRSYLRAYVTVIGATTCFALSMYGLMSWVPAFYERNFDWNRAEIGQAFGSIFLFVGTAGLVCSGLLAEKAMKRGVADACPKVMLYAQMISLIPLASLVAVHDPYWSLGCLAVAVFFVSFHIGLTPAALHLITPNEMRGQIIAIYIFVLTLFGLGAGSPAIAAMTDFYFQDDAAVGKSVAVVTAASSSIGVVLLWVGIGAYRRAVAATAL
jgi:MFS family permease